jgi:molybdate transport system substrate-binding protein
MEASLAKLRVMCARSMHVAVGVLGRAFAQSTGNAIEFDFDTVGGLQDKLNAGETADVLILSFPAIEKLESAGRLVPGSRRNVARTFIALCTQAGAPVSDISTSAAFVRQLQSARSVAISDPAVGGSAGVHLAKMFEREGLSAIVRAKSLPQKTGADVARRVVEGTAEFGLTLSGEIASVGGAVIAGPLPPPFGQDTLYCAAIMTPSSTRQAAADLIAALTDPKTEGAWRQAGFALP